jgi:CheY-like chemotaxis protein
MPGMDGFEVLAALAAAPRLRWIPTVVLSTSDAAADIQRCYVLGANSFVIKCFKFDELVTRMREICRYWLTLSSLPKGG